MKRYSYMLLTAILVAAGCGNSATTPSATATATDMPADQILYDLRHNMTTEGIRRAELRGDTAYLFENGARIDLTGVNLVFFSDNGAESGNLTSETGEYQPRLGSMIARGNVVLVTRGPEGEKELETEELHFDVDGDRMWSDMPVVMREGGRTVRGTSFRSDARFQNVTVTRAQTEGASAPAAGGGGISF